ncbi:unnamed protein product, partial [Prorocentrum cordatum]
RSPGPRRVLPRGPRVPRRDGAGAGRRLLRAVLRRGDGLVAGRPGRPQAALRRRRPRRGAGGQAAADGCRRRRRGRRARRGRRGRLFGRRGHRGAPRPLAGRAG